MSHHTHRSFLGRIVQRSLLLSGQAAGDVMGVVPRFVPVQQNSDKFVTDKQMAGNSAQFDFNSDIDKKTLNETSTHSQQAESNSEGVKGETESEAQVNQDEAFFHTDSVDDAEGPRQQLDTPGQQSTLSSAERLVDISHDKDISKNNKKSADSTVVEVTKPNNFFPVDNNNVFLNEDEQSLGNDNGNFKQPLQVKSKQNKQQDIDTLDESTASRSSSHKDAQESLRGTLSPVDGNKFTRIESADNGSSSKDFSSNELTSAEPYSPESENATVSERLRMPQIKYESGTNKATNVTGVSISANSKQALNNDAQYTSISSVSSLNPSKQEQKISTEGYSPDLKQVPEKKVDEKSDMKISSQSYENNQRESEAEHVLSDKSVLPTIDAFSDSVNVNHGNTPIQQQSQNKQAQAIQSHVNKGQGESTPVVNVSIGKVVVKAPAAQEVVHQPGQVVKSRRPGISLGDYLKD